MHILVFYPLLSTFLSTIHTCFLLIVFLQIIIQELSLNIIIHDFALEQFYPRLSTIFLNRNTGSVLRFFISTHPTHADPDPRHHFELRDFASCLRGYPGNFQVLQLKNNLDFFLCFLFSSRNAIDLFFAVVVVSSIYS